MIIEPAGGGISRAGTGEGQPQGLLGPGLADAPGNRDDPSLAAITSRRPERGKTGEGIGDDE
jgi:hypothetical protein